MRPHKPFKTNQLTTYETGDSPAATLSSRKHVNSPNVEGTVFQTFLNYKQRSCIQFITKEQVKHITNLFDMRAGQFHAGNTLCTFNLNV